MSGSESRDERLAALVRSEAAARGIVDPEAAVTLVDRSLIVFEENGRLGGVREAVAQLAHDKPYLLPRASADLGARGREPEGRISRESLRGMAPQAIVDAHARGRLDHLL